MKIQELNLSDWKRTAHDMEVVHWKRKYERTVRLCKLVQLYEHEIWLIQLKLDVDKPLEAAELWNELDYEVQKLLITAPRFGGPFTTEERAKIKELWEVSIEDLDK